MTSPHERSGLAHGHRSWRSPVSATSTFSPDCLLWPLGIQQFIRDYWTERPLILRRSAQYYRSLLGLNDLEETFNSSLLRIPSIQLLKGGKWISPETYTYDFAWGDQHFRQVIDRERAFLYFMRGATLVFQALHLHSDRVRQFCRCLERHIGFATTANAYITPPNAAGFLRHADLHEVFILQIAGAKRWLYQMPKGRVRTAQLTEGDLLYLPKGTKHQAKTESTLSGHVTIAVHTLTWFDAVRSDLDRYKTISPLSHVLPSSPEGLKAEPLAQVRALLHSVAREFQPAVSLQQRRRDLASSTPEFTYRFAGVPRRIGSNTRIRLRRGLTLKATATGRICLESDSASVTLPLHVTRAVRLLMVKPIMRVRELPGLTEVGRKKLITFLVREGLLELLRPSRGALRSQ
jgi:lysine-specific demethylase/histidyl-hydroxylase NO66